MKKTDWYWFLIFIVMMTVVGFFVFDNMASQLIFGIAVGGTFGWLFATKNANKKG